MATAAMRHFIPAPIRSSDPEHNLSRHTSPEPQAQQPHPQPHQQQFSHQPQSPLQSHNQLASHHQIPNGSNSRHQSPHHEPPHHQYHQFHYPQTFSQPTSPQQHYQPRFPSLPIQQHHYYSLNHQHHHEDDATFKEKKEEEKRSIAQWEDLKRPLSPSQVAIDPARKRVGHSMSHLSRDDFDLIKTLGTGTFARVWLAKLADAKAADKDKVFALKILRKVDVIKLKQVEHVRNERNVLAGVAGHPFITTMVASFQDHDSLYMLLDYCPGGEVFSYLRRARRFNEPTSQFYAAEICLILEFLHEQQGVAYRDLKPENILIDAEGHLKLVDFGFAKKVENRETYTLCGTPEYLAPEVIRNTGHGCAVDWWAFGILIYEFLVGQPPFWDQNPMKIYEQIVAGYIRFPSAMSHDARSIIQGLCTVDVSKRLGNIKGGAATVKSHPWFRDIDWDALYHRRYQGPIVPHLRSKDDTRNFDEYDPEPDVREPYGQELRDKWDSYFKDF